MRSILRPEAPHAQLTEDQIKQQWRRLGFFCELDDQKKVWTLTGSRAGLLYFPDLLLGYVADPQNAIDGQRKHYGPYGSLELMTWAEPAFGGKAIRGSLIDLARLAGLIPAGADLTVGEKSLDAGGARHALFGAEEARTPRRTPIGEAPPVIIDSAAVLPCGRPRFDRPDSRASRARSVTPTAKRGA